MKLHRVKNDLCQKVGMLSGRSPLVSLKYKHPDFQVLRYRFDENNILH